MSAIWLVEASGRDVTEHTVVCIGMVAPGCGRRT